MKMMLAVESSFDELVADMNIITHPTELRSLHHSSHVVAVLFAREEKQIEMERA